MSTVDVLSKGNVEKLSRSFFGYAPSYSRGDPSESRRKVDIQSNTGSWVSSSTRRTRQRTLVPSATDNALQAFDNTIRKTGVYQQIMKSNETQQDRERTPYRLQRSEKNGGEAYGGGGGGDAASAASSSSRSAVSSGVSNITLSLYSQGLYEMNTDDEALGVRGKQIDSSDDEEGGGDALVRQRSILEELVLGGRQVVAPAGSNRTDYSSRPSLSDLHKRKTNKHKKNTKGEQRHVSPILEQPHDHVRYHQQRKQEQRNRIPSWQAFDKPAGGATAREAAGSSEHGSTSRRAAPVSRSADRVLLIKSTGSDQDGTNNKNTGLQRSHSVNNVGMAKSNFSRGDRHALRKSMTSADLLAQRKRLEEQHQQYVQQNAAANQYLPRINGKATAERKKSRGAAAKSRSEKIREKLPAMDVLRTLPLQSELEQFRRATEHSHALNQTFTKYVRPAVGNKEHTFRSGGPISRPK